ncbi:alpha-N-acetylglucosaminidase [Citrus sinensis]|uniref:Alpha-N-acetylglucosaminidase n=1 Tax=Citrus sinensis TaxID=2711 RepID=A0ACB8LRC3_CITSI|nr:alpha-N-acetylglucosaminidase [Citrus sinensis]
MDSPFRSVSLILFFIITITLSTLAVAQSSTIGVQYISRLLDIQERERAPPSVQLAAAYAVLQRLLPSHYSAFQFRIISKKQCDGEYCFILRNHPSSYIRGTPEIVISGVTGVEVLAGLHWYLRYWCGSHISWDKTGGVQVASMPKLGSFPRVQDAGVLVKRPIPLNYYQNAVTSSYTFAWWDWKRWEKEIDWMALQGINLPLAFTGQEAIWQKVFQKFNISNSDLDDFFGGPGFLAWSLLPAFSGNVPAALQNVFPSAKITQLGNWFSVKSDPRWCCTYLLDATDPLFIEIGRAFIEQQLKEYGRTSHIYNCDTFDENTPPVDSPEYISSLGAAIYSGMQSGDSDAVWLMQALLNSVPLGKLVVLDLFAEVKPIWSTSKQFYGVPYIWCMLHNFAGNIEMYGILDSIAFGPVEARTSENTTMASLFNVGVGMSMEGIEQNPVVYDLMSEMAFQHEKVDVKAWINQYSVRRYGRSVPAIQDAWNVLYHTVYNCTDGATDKNRDVIVAFPDVDPSIISVTEGKYQNYGKPVSKEAVLKSETSSYDHPHLWYSTSEVIRALELFIASGNELSASNTYRYDLIDLTRQALAKYANELFLNIIEAYQLNDAHGVFQLSRRFLELVEDMDSLLACHDGFLLGPWLESAKQLAQNEEQEKQYEWNARTQITMWFDNTEEEASLLRDYGNKYWSGLLRDYYGPRAAIYFKYMIESLESGDGFRLKDWRREWIKLTNDWQNGRNVYPVESNGDALITSQWLYNKYLQGTSVFDH